MQLAAIAAAEQRQQPQHGAQGAAQAANVAGGGQRLEAAHARGLGRTEFYAPDFQQCHVVAARTV
jgi:hypothetical protein